MSTRSTLASELSQRLGDSGNAIWPLAELKSYIDYSIKGLYPTFYRYKVTTTTAGNGPLQTMPTGARNLYALGLQAVGSTRVRRLRNWQEGDGNAYVTKTGIAGATLVWSWTEGWDAPAADGDTLTIPFDSEDIVLMRSQVKALERLLADRVSLDKYFSLNVRQAASEADIADTIDGLRNGLADATSNVLPLPEKQN